MTGMVEKFADIRPERVRLAGIANQPVFVDVTITPRADLPFTIKKIKAKSGNYIRYELKQRCNERKAECVIRVENMRKDKGRYVDALFLQTDSQIRPTIPIFITGIIR